jgi:FtsZ-binding cell division protein ZapB
MPRSKPSSGKLVEGERATSLTSFVRMPEVEKLGLPASLIKEAAEEIGRLRAEVERLRAENERLQRHVKSMIDAMNAENERRLIKDYIFRS